MLNLPPFLPLAVNQSQGGGVGESMSSSSSGGGSLNGQGATRSSFYSEPFAYSSGATGGPYNVSSPRDDMGTPPFCSTDLFLRCLASR